MAVTDLTDSLPWWTRQGAGPTGGPGAAPMGAGGQPGGVGGQPPPGVNPQAWLAYLTQMMNPVSSAEASPLHPDLNSPFFPLNSAGGSSPPMQASMQDGGNPHGDGPPGPVSQDPRLGSSVTVSNQAQPGPMTGPAGPVSNLPTPQRPPLAGPQTGPAGPIANLPPGPGGQPQTGPPPQPPYNPLSGGSANTGLPAAPAATAPVPGPLATGGAGGQGATSNPRFVQLDQGQNTDPAARNRGPQMTALNLAGLFGGGGGVNPNVPAANAQTVSGPLAQGGMSNAPLSMGPLQKGRVFPSQMGPFSPDQIAGRGLRQRYG